MSFCKNISVATTAFPLLFSIFLLSWSPQQIDASILHSALITQDTTPPAPTAIVIKAEPNPAMPDAKPGTLFAGIDNIISLDIPKGVNPDNIQVQLDGGNVHKLAAGRYVITLEKPGAVAINTFLVEGNNRKFMGGSFFKVENAPADEARDMPEADKASLQAEKGAEIGGVSDVMIKSGEKVSIESDHHNILYFGMETPITLYVHGYDLKKCTARLIGTGTMTGEEGHYRVGKSDRNEVDIEIAFDNEGTEQILTRQHYRIENLPDPTMFFANKKSGDITKEQLLGGTVLQAVWNDLYFKPEAEIITYSVTIVAPDGETNIYNVRGAELPANVQRLFKYLAEGSTIFFDDIQVKCPGDQSARNLRGVVLTLKG